MHFQRRVAGIDNQVRYAASEHQCDSLPHIFSFAILLRITFLVAEEGELVASFVDIFDDVCARLQGLKIRGKVILGRIVGR